MVRARLLPLALAVAFGVSALPAVSALASVQTAPRFSTAAITGSAVVAEAERYLGYPYSYTGDSPATGFSCIGFVWFVYHELGMNIPGTNPTAVGAYPQVSESNLEPGDLVFFQGTFAGLYPSHVAIYIGGGRIIHAANPSYGVTISSLVNDPRDGDYWQQHYLSAERPWTGGVGTGGRVIHRRHIFTVVVPALDLRSGPSFGYTVMTVLSEDSRVTLEGWAPGWIRVKDIEGTVGWVDRSGVQRDYGYVVRAAIRHHAGAMAIWRAAKSVYVYSLNVHTAPYIGAAVAFTLPRGSRVAVLTHSGSWTEIKTAHGAEGWVVTGYLGRRSARSRARYVPAGIGHTPLRYGVNVRDVPSMAGAVEATSNGIAVHVLRRDGSWAEVRLSNGTVGWVDRAFLGYHRVRRFHRARSITGGIAVYPGVNIHSGPGTGYSVVGGTYAGMRVRVEGYRNGFAHVRTSAGYSGWIEARFLEGRSSGGARRAARRGPHATATIRVHAAAGLTAGVIGLIYAGEHVVLLGESGGWDLIRLSNGATGYVDAAYIRG